MSIQSHAFGRVTLTEGDAKKFTNQVKHGRPKAAAKESVKRGSELVREWGNQDSISFTLTVRGERREP